jgi:hypothetical protein
MYEEEDSISDTETKGTWPYPRTRTIDAVFLLHIGRAAILFVAGLLYPDLASLTGIFAIVEIFVGYWFWNQRLESWGVALGLALSHFFFPWAVYLSEVVFILLAAVGVVQVLLQYLIRRDGHYSFVSISIVQPERGTEPTMIQSVFFNLTVAAQLFKAGFLFLTGVLVYLALGASVPIPWLGYIPAVQTMLFLAGLEVLIAIAVFQGREWAFHLMLVMAVISLIEYLLSLSIFVFMLGIWIISLLTPCLAKDGFYSKFMKRRSAS